MFLNMFFSQVDYVAFSAQCLLIDMTMFFLFVESMSSLFSVNIASTFFGMLQAFSCDS